MGISNLFEDVNLNWLITGKVVSFNGEKITIQEASKIYSDFNEPEPDYIIENKLLNSPKKTI